MALSGDRQNLELVPLSKQSAFNLANWRLAVAPTFSVVIPTFNHARFLKAAIDSVLAQTYDDFEIIIVNNFSTDNTLEVIEQLNDPRIQVFNFQNNGVIGAARNVGIMASQGLYVGFLDSDDTWYPNKLELIAKVIDADPEVGLLCHDQDLVRDGQPVGRAQFGPPQGVEENLYDHLLLKGNCVSTSAAVVERGRLDQVGCFSEDPSIATVEDYDLWLRLSKVCRFQFIPEVLGLHQYHAAGVSANVEVHLKATLAVLNKHFNEHQNSRQPYRKRAINWQYANVYFGAARQYHRRGSLRRTLVYYVLAIRTSPLYLRTYPALILFLLDSLLGQKRRKRAVNILWPGSWLAGWTIS